MLGEKCRCVQVLRSTWTESLRDAYRGALVAKKTIAAGHLPLLFTAKLVIIMLNDVIKVKEVKCVKFKQITNN